MSRRDKAKTLTAATDQAAPRIAICRCPAVVSVVGSRRSYSMTAGAQVDLDDVVGECDGVPLTLADALGPHLAQFDIVGAAPVAPTVSQALGADDSEE